MKKTLLFFVLMPIFTLVSCKKKEHSLSILEIPQKELLPTFTNKAHQLVYQMVQKVGNYQKLLDKKDVEYTYSYLTPTGKKDLSKERYIFEGELSYGAYSIHERTLPELEGILEQGFNGKQFWLKSHGQEVEGIQFMKRVIFNRKTNFYWFAMMQKLLDPGVVYTYVKQDTIANKSYDIVNITFVTKNQKPTDIYQLYINKETQLVDQFLFTVVDFKVVTPFLMKVEYEKVADLWIPTKRKYTQANWEGTPLNSNWIYVNWKDIKFNNGFTIEDFEK